MNEFIQNSKQRNGSAQELACTYNRCDSILHNLVHNLLPTVRVYGTHKEACTPGAMERICRISKISNQNQKTDNAAINRQVQDECCFKKLWNLCSQNHLLFCPFYVKLLSSTIIFFQKCPFSFVFLHFLEPSLSCSVPLHQYV